MAVFNLRITIAVGALEDLAAPHLRAFSCPPNSLQATDTCRKTLFHLGPSTYPHRASIMPNSSLCLMIYPGRQQQKKESNLAAVLRLLIDIMFDRTYCIHWAKAAIHYIGTDGSAGVAPIMCVGKVVIGWIMQGCGDCTSIFYKMSH